MATPKTPVTGESLLENMLEQLKYLTFANFAKMVVYTISRNPQLSFAVHSPGNWRTLVSLTGGEQLEEDTLS